MQLPPRIAAGVADGTVTLAFRRWATPRVRAGSRFLTTAGLIEVISIEEVDESAVTQVAAEAAGADSPADVLKLSKGSPETALYRIGLGWAGPDPRIALRERAELTDAEVDALEAKLRRLDRASTHGEWTLETLRLIEEHPRVRGRELAAMVGRETEPFKIDVRKLKGLGLTRSFDIGFELSPRGREFLRRIS